MKTGIKIYRKEKDIEHEIVRLKNTPIGANSKGSKISK